MARKLTDDIDPRVSAKYRERVIHTASLISDENKPIKEKQDTDWAVNLKTREVHWRMTNPFPPHKLLTPEQLVYLVAHESGHLLDSTNFKTYSDRRRGSFDRFVNAFEDLRIEERQAKRYPGFNEFKESLTPDVLDFWVKDKTIKMADVTDQFGFYAWCRENGHDVEALKPLIDPSIPALYESHRDKLIPAVLNAKTTQEVSDIITPIYEQLQPQNKGDGNPPPSQQQSQSNQGQGQGEKSGTGTIKGKSEEVERGVAQSGSREKQQALYNAKQDASRAEYNSTYVDQAEEDWKRSEVKAEKLEKKEEVAGGTGTGMGIGRYGQTASWKSQADRVRPSINNLHRRLLSVLRANKQDVWESSHKRGRLDNRTAFRVMTGSPRVFKRKHSFGHYDYLVGIVIDVSGSMESRSRQATDAMVIIAEALDKSSIPFFVITYSNSVTSYKPSRFTLKKHGGDLVSHTLWPGGGTAEYSALTGAIKEFRAADKETVKVLISITDGTTASVELSMAMLDDLDRLQVHSFQIALNLEPAGYYKHSIRVDDMNALAPEMAKILKSLVRQGV